MPSHLHEGLVLLFRNRPQLAAELLRDTLHLQLPQHARASLASESLRETRPVSIQADSVVVLEDERAVLGIIVEVQLNRDDSKRYTWPTYLVLLRRELRCPVVLLVLTLDEDIAEWAAEEIDLGHPGFVLRPCVLGPAAFPLPDPAAVERDPELVVLACVAHANDARAVERTAEVVRALELADIDEERRAIYSDVVIAALPAAARIAVEELMSQKYEYQSDFAKRWIAEGEAKGIAQGRIEATARNLLGLLVARGFQVDASLAERIRSCVDEALLSRWFERALAATDLASIFDDG